TITTDHPLRNTTPHGAFLTRTATARHVPAPITPLRHHHGVAFLPPCPVSETSIRTRQARNPRELARHRESGAVQKTSGKFAQRRLPMDLPRQFFRETLFGQAPEVSELWLIDHFARHNDH